MPVEEVFQGKTVWKGIVEVFDLTGHPNAKQCYAWGHAAHETGNEVRIVTCRQWIRCGHCDRPLTGSKPTGRKGVKYAYYHCPKCGKVRVRTVDLERKFVTCLERMQPRPEYAN